MIRLLVDFIAAAPCQLVLAHVSQRGASVATGSARPRRLTIANRVWTGDFDKMLERRMIRVCAPFSRSLYFSDDGTTG